MSNLSCLPLVTLNLQTGNLLNCKKCLATPSKEVQDFIQKTLTEWSSKTGQDLNQEIVEVPECTVAQAVEKMNPEERDELKVSAKLFIIGSNSSSVRDEVDMACSALGIAQLDSVIIAPPPIEDGTSLSVYLQHSWQELESLVQNKKITTISTSDLDKMLLEQLYVWAQVKPSSNHVNQASCCVMPPDLTGLAKQVDIRLLSEIKTQKNYFVKQGSKKFFGKASRMSKHINGFLYGFSDIQSLLKAEELSSPKAISCKLK